MAIRTKKKIAREEALRILREAAERSARVPVGDRVLIDSPKFTFPLGLDSDGNLFGTPRRGSSPRSN